MTYAVFFDDSETPMTSGSFTWSETGQNYLSVGNNLTNTSKLDNFEIRANAAPPASDYDTWAASYPGVDLSEPTGDSDGDGLTNDEERIWGLDPANAASVNPISVPLDPGAGALSYTRRDSGLNGLTYSVWTSTDLEPGSWTEDTGATQVSSRPDENDIETVAVTLTGSPVDGRLFVRIEAAE